MTYNFLDKTGLKTILSQLKQKFASAADLAGMSANNNTYLTNIDYSLLEFDKTEIVSDVTELATPIVTRKGDILSWNVVDGATHYYVLSKTLGLFTGLISLSIELDSIQYSYFATQDTSVSLKEIIKSSIPPGVYTLYVVAVKPQGKLNLYSEVSNGCSFEIYGLT
jgi:hypothetical protein